MKKSLLFCLMSLAFSAQAGTLLPAGAADQSPTRLQSAPLPAGEFERKPVSFAWALDPQAGVETPAPFVAETGRQEYRPEPSGRRRPQQRVKGLRHETADA